MYPQREHTKHIQTNLPYKESRLEIILKAMVISDHSCLINDDHNRIQCRGCRTSISVHAEHAFQFLVTKCARKPSSIMTAVGNQHTHSTHDIKLYGGDDLRVKCGAIAVNKLLHLRNKCGQPMPALKYNLKAYAKGLAPNGFEGLLYTRLQPSDKVVVKNVQSQVDRIWKTYVPERLRQEDLSASSCEGEGSQPESVDSGGSSSD